MRLEQAFSLVVSIEAQEFASNLTWRSIKMWPLIRQCLWLELTQSAKAERAMPPVADIPPLYERIFKRIVDENRAFHHRPKGIGVETTAFISRPVYLQELPSKVLFDRIVDPLISCMPDDALYAKYYVAPWPDRQALHYSAALLRPARMLSHKVRDAHGAVLRRVAIAAGIAPEKLLVRYAESLKAFNRWYEAGRNFFDSRKNLKTVYLTSWYFPDMMGLIAAAREYGVETVDVQHGKQGRLQAMYSGWRIPDGGYQMMPNVFWCWGQPSAEHILASSSCRKTHRPIVGGYPWLDYYRRYVSSTNPAVGKETGKCVLVTTQPQQGANIEPIPDFIIEFLRNASPSVRFVFRCHPNDLNGPAYCRQRLCELPNDRFEIDDGRSNLYDRMITATHHITAYSSCCYEASAFRIPTLLFGVDAQTIYGDEIASGFFSWTPGSALDVASWLETAKIDTNDGDIAYIFSSLEHATAIVRGAEDYDSALCEMKERSDA